MKTKLANFAKKIKLKKILKWTIIILILAGIGNWGWKFYKSKNQKEAVTVQRTALASKGTITQSVTGSGALTASQRVEISPTATGNITRILKKEGDTVKKGDLLFELDDKDAINEIDKARSNLKQAELSQATNKSDLEKRTYEAPFTGYISEVQVREGDTVGKGTTIATLTDKSKYKLTQTLPYLAGNKAKVGQKANVMFYDFMMYLDGTVSYVSDKNTPSPDGGEQYNIEVIIDNPGYSLDGLNAMATVEGTKASIEAISSNTIGYIDTIPLKSPIAGTIKTLNIKNEQLIQSGGVIMELINEDLVNNIETADLKLVELQTQLDYAIAKLSDYKVYAPIGGTIVSQNLIIGDGVKPGTVASIIANNKYMQFDVQIDELDIAKIKVGQKVNITIDALSDTTSKPLSGEVSKIAIEGTPSNGVTTYPVTILFEGNSNIKGGMNANANILIVDKNDTLYVPVEAVQSSGGNTVVMVKNSETGESTPKRVTTGISNDRYIEIVSGLNEGEEVILPALVTQDRNTNNNASFIGGGAMTGGAIQGGGPVMRIR